MCTIQAEQVAKGPIKSERIVRFRTVDSVESIVVPATQVRNGRRLVAEVIHRAPRKVLVELPRESLSGRWRVWVNRGLLK